MLFPDVKPLMLNEIGLEIHLDGLQQTLEGVNWIYDFSWILETGGWHLPNWPVKENEEFKIPGISGPEQREPMMQMFLVRAHSGILSDKQVPNKLKEKFYRTVFYRPQWFMSQC